MRAVLGEGRGLIGTPALRSKIGPAPRCVQASVSFRALSLLCFFNWKLHIQPLRASKLHSVQHAD